MRQTRLIRPLYSQPFRCIGPDCEDTCCAGWTVNIDQAALERFQQLPSSPLRTLIDASIAPRPEIEGETAPGACAQIQLTPTGQCALLSSERLCRIHAEAGESYLPHLCATYPRKVFGIDGQEEKSLSLSCPEAARLVLLDPNLLDESVCRAQQIAWDDAAPGASAPRIWFWPIREFALRLVRNRAYPLWQRLFLLGSFCRRLDAICHGTLDRTVPVLLREFSLAAADGTLRAAMETIPADLPLQLEMLMELVRLRVDHAYLNTRLRETLRAFIEGIAMENGAAREEHVARYAFAYQHYYAPFFLRHQHILENYLINAIFGGLFPFGRKLFDKQVQQEPAQEFALLAMHFTLVKGLLIGVAGCHREAFSADHVVQTIQTVSRHFDHSPRFLLEAHKLLTARRLDNAQVLAMMLRN